MGGRSHASLVGSSVQHLATETVHKAPPATGFERHVASSRPAGQFNTSSCQLWLKSSQLQLV